MTNFDYYLTEDHAARKRTTLISAATSAVLGVILQSFNVPLNVAAIICVVAVVAVETIRAISYRQPSLKAQRDVSTLQPRRYLLGAFVSACGLFALSLVRIPRLEAAIAERQLREATEGPPPYDKASRIVSNALQNNIPISRASVQSAQRQITRDYFGLHPTDQESVRTTLSQFLEYQIYALTGVKLNLAPVSVVVPARVNDLTGAVFEGKAVGVLVGEDRSRTILNVKFNYEPRTPGAVVFVGVMQLSPSYDLVLANFSVQRMSDDVLTAPGFVALENVPYRVAVLDVNVSNLTQILDDVIWINVTFHRCRIKYNGGQMRLKDVVFHECEFVLDNESGRAMLEIIRAREGTPITIGLPTREVTP